MQQVGDLRQGWEMEKAAAVQKKAKKAKAPEAPAAADELFPEEEVDAPVNTKNLFDDSDDSDAEAEKPTEKQDKAEGVKEGSTQQDLFGDSDDSDEEDANANAKTGSKENAETTEKAETTSTQQELFGDSSDGDSDEELVPPGAKRGAAESDEQPAKKRKVVEDSVLEDSD
jgi:hypothetical protein